MERHQRRDGGMEAGCHTGDRAKLAQSDERTVTRAIAGAGGGIVLPLRARWPSQIVRIPPVRDRSRDRKSVVLGKRVSVRVDLGGRRILKNTQNHELTVKATD